MQAGDKNKGKSEERNKGQQGERRSGFNKDGTPKDKDQPEPNQDLPEEPAQQTIPMPPPEDPKGSV